MSLLLYTTVAANHPLANHPLLVPFYSAVAWTFMLLLAWSIWAMLRDTLKRAIRMHQIPCANCQFFTRDYHLKCTVNPDIALSEAAIGCPDYQEKINPFSTSVVKSLSQVSKPSPLPLQSVGITAKVASKRKET